MSTETLWGLFMIVGLGTFLIRVSFIQFHGSMQWLLKRSSQVLMLLPPAILAALCVPAILFQRPTTAWVPDYSQILAALVTVLVARHSGSVFWPVITGMACLWGYRWLPG